ncbi:cupin domain-containing protein [Roseiconus nitratireducens]|uniref:Cupin domain-containing protein n=1 Tax=Roseiconus nitratireducens TaxID=2605748 RepID=A0A5M6D6H9_9BACT|nr:cupin domain-containing protein [Roseiconus nitratireducens]KAA5543101.1 cupin domain-containing protein [Roseiconus nitratireducens]
MKSSLDTGNVLKNLPRDLASELVTVLAQNRHVRIERIVSSGHTTPPDEWYDQVEDEWVLVIAGRALLRFEDPSEEIRLEPGDHVLIPRHRKHRVGWTSETEPTVWLAVFFPP